MAKKKVVVNENADVPRNKAEDDATYPNSAQRAQLRLERDGEVVTDEEKHPSQRPTELDHPRVEKSEE